jgi:hypothetical protein
MVCWYAGMVVVLMKWLSGPTQSIGTLSGSVLTGRLVVSGTCR